MIRYHVRAHKNIATKAVLYYAEVAPVSPMNIEQICANITEVCTVTRHDIKCVLSALQSEILKACQNGQSVRLGDLGSFRPTLCGAGSPTQAEVKAENIRRVRCRFVPGALIYKRFALKNPEVKFYQLNIPGASAGGGGSESL